MTTSCLPYREFSSRSDAEPRVSRLPPVVLRGSVCSACGQRDGARRKQRIAFSASGNLWTVNPDGTGAAVLADVPGGSENQPAWSAEGTRIAFPLSSVQVGQSGIWVADADGSDASLAVPGEGEYPSWSPDGQRLTFWQPRGPNNYSDLMVVNVDGTGLTPLTDTPSDIERSPSWSPDGTTIAFAKHTAPFGIHVVDAAGGTPTHLFLGFSPDWSPFGDELAYINGQNGISRRRLDQAGETSLLPGPAPVSRPAYSPDGAMVAVVRSSNLLAISHDGSEVRTVISWSNANDPAWQPLRLHRRRATSGRRALLRCGHRWCRLIASAPRPTASTGRRSRSDPAHRLHLSRPTRPSAHPTRTVSRRTSAGMCSST